MKSILRPAGGHARAKVTFVELFFDLVFVFAVTQLSHTLMADFTPLGWARVGILLPGVWWIWIFTSWVTNWLDPDRFAGRLMVFGLMFGGLILSAALPQAFAERGAVFGCAFAFMQVGRTLFFTLLLGKENRALRTNFIRILAWLFASGTLWIAGGFAGAEHRLFWWGVALLIEYVGPMAYFWTPGLGRSSHHDWKIDGAHMAERCGLFVIIALGESLLVTGASFAGLSWNPANTTAFVASFLGGVAMWWLYFDVIAEAAGRVLIGSKESGKLARLAYTYCHLPIVAGIILSAVSDEFVLAHPAGPSDLKIIVSTLGGSALYLVGTLLFKRVMTGRTFRSSLAGLAALAALAPFAARLPGSLLMLAASLILLTVAAVESRSAKHCPALNIG